jgi:CubicO group peptidase (beta-lactamase class C family)
MHALKRQVASTQLLAFRRSTGLLKLMPRMLLRSSLFVWMLSVIVVGVHAQELMAMRAMSRMDNPERVEEGLKALGDRVYRLKPAKITRTLPIAPWDPTLQTETKSYARNRLATVVVEGGRLVYESYGTGVKRDTLLHGFSVTKALTALAVGEALCTGHIKSLDELAQTYVPAVKDTAYGQASLRNLLGYTSGAKDPRGNGYVGIHSYSDFGAMWLGTLSLQDLLIKHGDAGGRFKQGEYFIYNGLDSETLSLVIRAATGKSLPVWFEETVWQQAGGEHAAAWIVDRDGNGIAQVAAFFSALDYARLGLYVQERLSDKAGSACIRDFLKEASQSRTTRGKEYWRGPASYGLGLHNTGQDRSVFMLGYEGQLVGVNPSNERVFITLNDRDGPETLNALGILARPPQTAN